MLDRLEREAFERECRDQFTEAGFDCWTLWDGDDGWYTVRLRRGDLARNWTVTWTAIRFWRCGIRDLVRSLVKQSLEEVRRFNAGSQPVSR